MRDGGRGRGRGRRLAVRFDRLLEVTAGVYEATVDLPRAGFYGVAVAAEIDSDGRIAARWDNVLDRAHLEQLLRDLPGATP